MELKIGQVWDLHSAISPMYHEGKVARITDIVDEMIEIEYPTGQKICLYESELKACGTLNIASTWENMLRSKRQFNLF